MAGHRNGLSSPIRMKLMNFLSSRDKDTYHHDRFGDGPSTVQNRSCIREATARN
jgi:hypothetical protein